MRKFSNLKNDLLNTKIQKSLVPPADRKIEHILNNLQIEIFDQNEDWEGTAQIKGIQEAVEQLSILLNNNLSTKSRQILESCLNHIYTGNIKQIQHDLETLNENSNEPEYWEEAELGIDNTKVKDIFKQSGITLYDIDFLENTVKAYIDCEASGMSYDTVDALERTTSKLRGLEHKAEALGFFMKINPDPFISGRICIILEQ